MKVTIATIVLAATAVSATAIKIPSDAKLQPLNNMANKIYEDAIANGCDWYGCVLSLAGQTAACGAAAAELGANIFADLACLASVGSAGRACKGCP